MNATRSPIELLPAELLDLILDDLDTRDISHVSQCNKYLQCRSQPLLYQSEDDRAAAMSWGCAKGNIDAIRRAISYGAPTSTVRGAPGAEFRALTLHLAAKNKNNLETFRFLIQHGAMAPDWADLLLLSPNAVPNMMRLLSCGKWGGHPFLHVFLEADLASQLDCDVLNDTLLSLIETSDKTTPLDSVRILLDTGASPNHLRIGGQNKYSTSLLSAALLRDRPDMFRLLLDRGANVHGAPVQYPLPSLPLHVPILAASYTMASSASRSQIKLCVEHGADINVCVPFFAGIKKHRKMTFTTPLRSYINHVLAKHWIDMRREPQVASDLVYLFDSGATFEGGDDKGDMLKVLEKEYRSVMRSPNSQFAHQLSAPLPTVEHCCPSGPPPGFESNHPTRRFAVQYWYDPRPLRRRDRCWMSRTANGN